MENVHLEIESLEKRIAAAEDFMERMELKDELLNLKRKAGMIKPPDQEIECVGCGS